MLKISNKASINLSLVFSGALMAALIVMACVMPFFIPHFGEMVYPVRQISKLTYIYLGIVVYLMLIVAGIADTFLFSLLLIVKRGLVFTDKSISRIRYVSWAVFAESFLFLLIAPYTFVGIFISVAALMLGIALRVVKNVLSEAILIKNENDFTV